MPVEQQERTQSYMQKEIVQPTSNEWAVELVTHRASFKDRVILEGSPIYLYPNDEYPSQSWDHPAFVQGWALINQLREALPRNKTTPYVLVDEFNNLPDDYTNRDFLRRFVKFVQSSPVIADSPIAHSGVPDSPVVYRLESEYTRADDSSFNVCSNLDAQFQKEKILFQRPDSALNLAQLRSTLLVVVHPVDFQRQQASMLTSLLGEMKQYPFHAMSKEERRTVISEMFVHVWLENNGDIGGVTRPFWDGQKFTHQELE